MVDFPEYSESARGSIDLFIADQVAFIFYFEDGRHESVYERLVRLLFPRVPSFGVICPGGKSKVIEKARSRRVAGPTYIFVVDKDFDDLLGKVQTVDDLYYLDRHCLENYLLDIEALVQIAVEEKPDLKLSHVEAMTSDRDAFLNDMYARYDQITRMFIVARRYDIDVKTTGMKTNELLSEADPNYPLPSATFLSTYRTTLLEVTNRHHEWLSETDFGGQAATAFSGSGRHHYCGKHVFDMMTMYICARLGADLALMDVRSLYLRLLARVDLAEFHTVRQMLILDHPRLI